MLQVAKQIKSENHAVEWEITKNHICQLHVTEKIRALQLLRVTKGCVITILATLDVYVTLILFSLYY